MDTFQSYNILIVSIIIIFIGKVLKNKYIIWLAMISFLTFSIMNTYLMMKRDFMFEEMLSFHNYSIIANYVLSAFSLFFIYILYHQMNS